MGGGGWLGRRLGAGRVEGFKLDSAKLLDVSVLLGLDFPPV